MPCHVAATHTREKHRGRPYLRLRDTASGVCRKTSSDGHVPIITTSSSPVSMNAAPIVLTRTFCASARAIGLGQSDYGVLSAAYCGVSDFRGNSTEWSDRSRTRAHETTNQSNSIATLLLRYEVDTEVWQFVMSTHAVIRRTFSVESAKTSG